MFATMAGMVDAKSDIGFLSEWLDQLPEQQIETRIAELEKKNAAILAELSSLREALALKQRFRDMYRPHIDSGEQRVVPGFTGRPPSSIRESVLRAMAETPQKQAWSVADIHNALVERNWSDLSSQAQRSLSASLSRMTADGEIKRIGRGLYQLAAPKGGGFLTDEVEGDPG